MFTEGTEKGQYESVLNGVTVVQEVEQVVHLLEGGGLIPAFSTLHAEVSLDKILNPKFLSDASDAWALDGNGFFV